MKPLIIAAIFTVAAAGGAFASSETRCNVPMSEWQPVQALKKKLEAKGWKIRRIKTDDGCYEVYAVDASGRRVEAYFNPKSLKLVRRKDDD